MIRTPPARAGFCYTSGMDMEMRDAIILKHAAMFGVFVIFVFAPVALSFNLPCGPRCFRAFFPLLQLTGIAGCIAILWWNKRTKTDSAFWYILASGVLALLVAFQTIGFIASYPKFYNYYS